MNSRESIVIGINKLLNIFLIIELLFILLAIMITYTSIGKSDFSHFIMFLIVMPAFLYSIGLGWFLPIIRIIIILLIIENFTDVKTILNNLKKRKYLITLNLIGVIVEIYLSFCFTRNPIDFAPRL